MDFQILFSTVSFTLNPYVIVIIYYRRFMKTRFLTNFMDVSGQSIVLTNQTNSTLFESFYADIMSVNRSFETNKLG